MILLHSGEFLTDFSRVLHLRFNRGSQTPRDILLESEMENEQLLDKVQNLLLGMEERINIRFEAVDGRFNGVDSRLDGIIEVRLGRVETRLGGVLHRQEGGFTFLRSYAAQQLLTPFIA
jgi:hypothetical protein